MGRNENLVWLFVRVMLPCGLLLSIILRPFGISLVYLLLLFLAPLIEVPTHKTMGGFRGKYLLLIFVLSVIFFCMHIAWHSFLASSPPYGRILESYNFTGRVFESLGFVPFTTINPLVAVFYTLPELVMLFVSLVVYFATKKLLSKSEVIKRKRYPCLTSTGKYICLLLIMFCGILRPSITSAIYFTFFLGASTAWALGISLKQVFAVMGRCLMAIMAVHVALLLIYQSPLINELYPPDLKYARYFGFSKIVVLGSRASLPYFSYYAVTQDSLWGTLVSPIALMMTYHVLAMLTREIFKPKVDNVELGRVNGDLGKKTSFRVSMRALSNWKNAKSVTFSFIDSSDNERGQRNAGENAPLVNVQSFRRRTAVLKNPSFHSSSDRKTQPMRVNSTGSAIFNDEESLRSQRSSITHEVLIAFVHFIQVLIRSSYIVTTIIMMAWSIMYHSWLTFVFLLWACFVWLYSDQRWFMLKSSPVLVFYAILLLIAQYIYSMNLNESELPTNITYVNLRQIGLTRESEERSVQYLLVKSLFTCMFWVTLRQCMQEKQVETHASVLDLPMRRSSSFAINAMDALRESGDRSRLFGYLGNLLRTACIRYWIYVVVIMLFVIGVTGERMTIFRIIYMFLFLSFILMFQISGYWWRKLMYMFWISVIIYSMVYVILLYVYQFDNFSGIITLYFMIDKKLQYDLGLSLYHPADLFVKLLTPTSFLVITVMQVHYFHKDFMAFSDPSKVISIREQDSSRSQIGGASTIKDDIPPLPMEDDRRSEEVTEADHSLETSGHTARQFHTRKTSSLDDIGNMSQFCKWLKKSSGLWWQVANKFFDKVFLFLDFHLPKIVLFSIMLMCVFNVCLIHLPIMFIITMALWLNSRKQRYCVLLISILVSVYFMMKMVYQIDNINHSSLDVYCSYPHENTTKTKLLNNAEWLGFAKTSKDLRLSSLLKGYIGLIAIFTFYSIVKYRHRAHSAAVVKDCDKVMFPNITRENADKDLPHCIKFFFNYGFYKFGVEITLICLVGVIGSRMDVYAVCYAFWLMVLVLIKRQKQARLWWWFSITISILIPFQYTISVGAVPQLCLHYPWEGSSRQMKQIRNWLFLPYDEEKPHAMKLIFDYLLLMFATCQLRVFNIEKSIKNYSGGSNSEDVGQDWENPGFVNPVPDFMGFVGTWLDVVKRVVFLGMMWVTLAIMFLTGTNRVNLFSIGYLVGSFIFLWQGTDFYLLPKQSILESWSWLLGYNVIVVLIKTLLQILGCLFSSTVQSQACWLVQLLGIGCVDKFAGGNIAQFIKMNYSKDAVCSVSQEDIGLAWDGVCFAFLIIQRRLFLSHYFYRVIDDTKATTVLASRGAELIESLRQKQMKLQDKQEIKILEKIKVKMERIKANQKKVQGIAKDPLLHDDDENEESQQGESDMMPLVRGDSETSARGYHTPDSPASPRGFHTPLSEASAPPSPPLSSPPTPPPSSPTRPPSPARVPPLTLTHMSHGGPPSPSSALMTASLSLDAYLEPRRISFGSPPSSDLVPRARSPEESYPVFSPPPIRRRHTVASPVVQRTSIISQSSRVEPHSHHTLRDRPYRPPAPTSHVQAIRSGDYYMFDDFQDSDVSLEQESSSDEEDDIVLDKSQGIGKLLSSAIKTDMRQAVQMRRASLLAISERRMSSIGQQEVQKSLSGHVQVDSENLEPVDAPVPVINSNLQTLKHLQDTICALISSILVTITRKLMRQSRDYRYVSHMLSIEKKLLKESDRFGIGQRVGVQKRWEPLPDKEKESKLFEEEMKSVLKSANRDWNFEGRKLSDISVPEIRILAPSMERGLDTSPPPQREDRRSNDDDDTSEHESAFSLQSTESHDVSLLEDQEESMFKNYHSPVLHVLYASWYLIMAHTNIVCYIMVFINQIQSATILSIPLPLLVFLWGTLSIPRPTKSFWVTLIAYTEVIVLIKSMFQFEILPWNQQVVPANMPFTAPRIIGIERKQQYALYDLLLLLIIFLHRFLLKSLGLWKESSHFEAMRPDAEYPIDDDDARLLIEGKSVEVAKKYITLHHSVPLSDEAPQTSRLEADSEIDDEDGRGRVEGQQESGPSQLNSDIVNNTNRASTTIDPDVINWVEGKNGEEIEEDYSSKKPDGQDKTNESRDMNAGPSKAPDDDHFRVNNDEEPIIVVMTKKEQHTLYSGLLLISIKGYLRPTRQFLRRMLSPGARVTADVYAYMFLCDFFNFLVVIFGFAAFGTQMGDGGVQAYLEENKVPIPFLVMLILQFALIVIDRALYLRKYMLGKILFQYALIFGVHIWMFFVLPFITERTFNALVPPPLWYMVKCIYLLLSAYQIRCGYPRRIIGNFLCKSYRFLNMIFFRGFMAVPFVFELRTLMDWIWTDTSMGLMDWLKMEDIFASVFLLKCGRYMENEYPQERGSKKSAITKYLLGGSVLAFVIAIIWFPLVFFAFGNTVGQPNPPTDVTVKIRIGSFLPIYQMSAQSHNIETYTEQDYTQLSNLYARDRVAQTFLSNYVFHDVAVVSLNPNSTMNWEISPPELNRLEQEVASNSSLRVKFTYVITHQTNAAANPPTIEDHQEMSLEAYINGKPNPERQMLYMMLRNYAPPDAWLNVSLLFPKFMKVFNKGVAKPAYQLMPGEADEANDARLYRDVQLRLERERGNMYWRVREKCTKSQIAEDDHLQAIPLNNCDMLVMYTFNDMLFPETLNFISGSGIIGLYTTFVFLASRVIRGFFSGIYTKIMFDDLPNVDRVLQLCLDIYLVREALELSLEEDLFAKLVFLYRSPETMIKWSRPKEEETDQVQQASVG